MPLHRELHTIRVTNLTKKYGDTIAVDDVSFAVEPGVVTGFLGPNGAGKSTTMRMILGLDAPTSGTVTIGAKQYRELAAPLREIGALLDAKAVEPGRTAANHLLWLAHSNGIARRRVDEVLDTVGLSDVASRRVGTFSLGMNQRLGIAAALLGDPPVLMFDEPINGLDPDGILWIRNIMRSLAAQGRTVFLSSHLMSEMAQTADQLIVIGKGQIIASGNIDDIVSRHATPSVKVRADRQDELVAQLVAAGGRADHHDAGAAIVTGVDSASVGAIATARGISLIELTPQSASLEEAFLELTHESTEYRAATPALAGTGA
jgi:ABC-2 type transport system ATP-binding protein